MTRIIAFVLALGVSTLPAVAQSRLSEKALGQLRATAAEIGAIEPGTVPEMLLKALIAAEDPAHLRRSPETSNLTKQLARLHLGAMPSLHSASTFLFTAYMWKYDRRLFVLYLPILILILIMAIGTRWHYAIDLPAGIALALFCMWASPRLICWSESSSSKGGS